MKNNLTAKTGTLQSTNVVYKFSCLKEDCALLTNVNYIGKTCTTLSRRITCHLQSGAPKDHFSTHHGERLTRECFKSNVVILGHFRDSIRLDIAEAIHIDEQRPAINIQNSNFDRTLKLFN